jgi:hypothetical protein
LGAQGLQSPGRDFPQLCHIFYFQIVHFFPPEFFSILRVSAGYIVRISAVYIVRQCAVYAILGNYLQKVKGGIAPATKITPAPVGSGFQTVKKVVSFRGSKATVGISRIFELFLYISKRFCSISGIATPVTSVTGSQ